MRESVRNAGLGAFVTIALSFIPFSSVAGGAIAAANHGGGYRTGLWLGSLAGVCAMVPLLALFIPALYIVGFLGFGIPPGTPGYDLFLALVFAFFLLYTVGLSALGGLGGVWVSAHTDWNLDADRWL
ncbi:hypothetical protein SAMN05443574_10630 [Haloarcula vallismortis]|uniref:DUF5518 domain-containing protein n=2 Tax=Haloarcula vallismortis TaxID=28442 RepID=M0JIF0_HALVA|nr:DUF5518 domain-containing protein [Haloarcula vallismortis]EMA07769.1 hypothetical protein C437_10013 [Haloarcula vallismortis ATCC 29715]SDW71602.1 hypothetical protein SAMN05443574_10630 [Haloarcula vallismortis]